MFFTLNLQGLLDTLVEIEVLDCERIVCLGDIVDGGTDDDELKIIEELQRREIPIVRGNHDEHHAVHYRDWRKQFLTDLPERIELDGNLLVHISPGKRQATMKVPADAWIAMDDSDYPISFVGHLHFPIIYGLKNDRPCEAKIHAFEYDVPFQLDREDRYIICVGAIGYSRDAMHKIRYAVFDDEAYTIEYKIGEGYIMDL